VASPLGNSIQVPCPVCDAPLTAPIKQTSVNRFTVTAVLDLNVLHQHIAAAHPDLAEPGLPASP
jgi:hypothetical protein